MKPFSEVNNWLFSLVYDRNDLLIVYSMKQLQHTVLESAFDFNVYVIFVECKIIKQNSINHENIKISH